MTTPTDDSHPDKTLHLYTDFVCPFCFIAEQSTVPRLLEEFDLVLDWHGFELHPGTPQGGRPLGDLFPGIHLPDLHEKTRRFGERFGVADFNPPDHLRNSRRALAMAEFARDHGRLAEFRAAAFEGHWRKGMNLEDDGDLCALAATAGLDPESAHAATVAPRFLARVDDKQAQARANGIRGIPAFLIGAVTIVGCQPYPVLADAVRRALSVAG